MTKKNKRIFDLLREQHPAAGPELNFKNNYELIIAVILSAQCTDKRVNEVTKTLFALAPEPSILADMELSAIEKVIKTCGLYRRKAVYIKETARAIHEDFGGEVPSDYERLLRLPGVSRKTANVVVSVGFGIPAIAVDTHVFRVSRRIGLAKGTNVDQVEKELMKAFPKDYWYPLHHLLIFHGRYVCAAKKPDCESCFIQKECAKKFMGGTYGDAERPTAGA